MTQSNIDEQRQQVGERPSGATDDPDRSDKGPSGWTPPERQDSYGRRGFGATGHGAGGYAGLGTFEVDGQDNPAQGLERNLQLSEDFNDGDSRQASQAPGNAGIKASDGAAVGSGGDLQGTPEFRTHKAAPGSRGAGEEGK